MSAIDGTLKANKIYASSFVFADLPTPPGRKLAVVTCMDARLAVEDLLGLKAGDAHIIRNAGGLVTDDVLRSLVLSTQLMGTREIMIIGHTSCGMVTFNEKELVDRLVRESGRAVVSPGAFLAFSDLEESVRRQVSKVAHHPWIGSAVSVRGFVFDVKSGALEEIS
jgi:carbonic anhydrase